MPRCTIRWRPSGGRGEFEYVPSNSLRNRNICLNLPALGVRIPAEVRGVHTQGKPRLRKFEANNREKLHLPQLVMAIAGLPQPARSTANWVFRLPLVNGSFLLDQIHFDIEEDDGETIVLVPLSVSIRDSAISFKLTDRLVAIAKDLSEIDAIRSYSPELAQAVQNHFDEIMKGENSTSIRRAADTMIQLKSDVFGPSNEASATTLIEVAKLPEVEEEGEEVEEGEEEDIVGREGNILTRMHVYRERDRTFARKVREHYRRLGNGKLICEVCGLDPTTIYGQPGDRSIEGHHTVPIEELQPDSETTVDEMAMVCANCHRVIHSKKPCFSIDEVRQLIDRQG